MQDERDETGHFHLLQGIKSIALLDISHLTKGIFLYTGSLFLPLITLFGSLWLSLMLPIPLISILFPIAVISSVAINLYGIASISLEVYNLTSLNLRHHRLNSAINLGGVLVAIALVPGLLFLSIKVAVWYSSLKGFNIP